VNTFYKENKKKNNSSFKYKHALSILHLSCIFLVYVYMFNYKKL